MRQILNTLFVTTQGTWLSQDGENVVVHLDRETSKKFPIHLFESIVCFGKVNATGPLMGFCGRKGVPISFLSENGRFLARVDGPVRGNVLLRREQYRTADDKDRSLAIAKSVIIGKIGNTRAVLMRSARDNPDAAPEILSGVVKYLARTVEELKRAASTDTLRGLEGDAAQSYFGVFNNMILNQKEEFTFEGRSRKPPMDRVNAMLSFVYSLLAHDIASALEGVGLDPAVGYLHKERPGRPSLALDIMEEFRTWLVDRLVLSLINLKQVKPEGFEKSESGAVLMDDVTRKAVIAAWQRRKQDELIHPFLGEKMQIGLIPHIQARLMARHIRGELEVYPPFQWK
jgi:CRISPR-associated protein Cas1